MPQIKKKSKKMLFFQKGHFIDKKHYNASNGNTVFEAPIMRPTVFYVIVQTMTLRSYNRIVCSTLFIKNVFFVCNSYPKCSFLFLLKKCRKSGVGKEREVCGNKKM